MRFNELLPSLSTMRLEAPICCVYFVVVDEQIVYVGQSVNLQSRVSDPHHHAQRVPGASVWYIPVARQDLDAIESAFIRRCNPELNRRPGSASSRGSESDWNLLLRLLGEDSPIAPALRHKAQLMERFNGKAA